MPFCCFWPSVKPPPAKRRRTSTTSWTHPTDSRAPLLDHPEVPARDRRPPRTGSSRGQEKSPSAQRSKHRSPRSAGRPPPKPQGPLKGRGSKRDPCLCASCIEGRSSHCIGARSSHSHHYREKNQQYSAAVPPAGIFGLYYNIDTVAPLQYSSSRPAHARSGQRTTHHRRSAESRPSRTRGRANTSARRAPREASSAGRHGRTDGDDAHDAAFAVRAATNAALQDTLQEALGSQRALRSSRSRRVRFAERSDGNVYPPSWYGTHEYGYSSGYA